MLNPKGIVDGKDLRQLQVTPLRLATRSLATAAQLADRVCDAQQHVPVGLGAGSTPIRTASIWNASWRGGEGAGKDRSSFAVRL